MKLYPKSRTWPLFRSTAGNAGQFVGKAEKERDFVLLDRALCVGRFQYCQALPIRADVHAGPSWFLAEKQTEFSKAEPIEVTGSRVKIGETEALIAREINKGDKTLTLRNAQGIPVWSRGRRK